MKRTILAVVALALMVGGGIATADTAHAARLKDPHPASARL